MKSIDCDHFAFIVKAAYDKVFEFTIEIFTLCEWKYFQWQTYIFSLTLWITPNLCR